MIQSLNIYQVELGGALAQAGQIQDNWSAEAYGVGKCTNNIKLPQVYNITPPLIKIILNDVIKDLLLTYGFTTLDVVGLFCCNGLNNPEYPFTKNANVLHNIDFNDNTKEWSIQIKPSEIYSCCCGTYFEIRLDFQDVLNNTGSVIYRTDMFDLICTDNHTIEYSSPKYSDENNCLKQHGDGFTYAYKIYSDLTEFSNFITLDSVQCNEPFEYVEVTKVNGLDIPTRMELRNSYTLQGVVNLSQLNVLKQLKDHEIVKYKGNECFIVDVKSTKIEGYECCNYLVDLQIISNTIYETKNCC